jgi:hypothetical protein
MGSCARSAPRACSRLFAVAHGVFVLPQPPGRAKIVIACAEHIFQTRGRLLDRNERLDLASGESGI